jgi:hypothetical protein
MFETTIGSFNTAVGGRALLNNTQGKENTAVGFRALSDNESGDQNTAVGSRALFDNHANRNTAVGVSALHDNKAADDNTAVGFAALFSNGNRFLGAENTAVGSKAMVRNVTGEDNTAVGFAALTQNVGGAKNTAIGTNALRNNFAGGLNTAVGFNALAFSRGNNNIALGDNAGGGVITANDVICIGHAVAGVNVNGTCFIGNIRGVTTQNANALPVVIDGAGQLGTVSSSQRFKHDIKPMSKASEAILALKPVTFHYKSDSTNIPQFGLIAEEVEKANPDLVVRDENGEIYTVRYDAVNAMLLNEFLKEHRKVEQLEKQVAALTAGLQKVTAQVEMTRTAPRMVVGNQ